MKTDGIEFRNNAAFWRETNSESVFENRKQILQKLESATKNCLVAVWLVEIDRGAIYLSLSYTNAPEKFRSAKHTDIIKTTEDELIGDKSPALSRKIDNALEEINSLSSTKIRSFHVRFDNFIQSTRKPERSAEDVVGILSVHHESKARVSTHDHLKNLAFEASEKLGRAIEQGRMVRILNASKEIHDLTLHSTTVEEALTNTARKIKGLISAERVSVLRIGAPDWPAQLSNDSKFEARVLEDQMDSADGSERVNYLLDREHQSSFSENANRYIFMPIAETAFELSKQSFTRMEEFDAKLDRSSLLTHAVIFRTKSTSLFHAQIFSSTDKEVCNFSKRYISSYVSYKHYEDRLDLVRKTFEDVSFSYLLSDDEIESSLGSFVNGVQGAMVLNVENPDDEKKFNDVVRDKNWNTKKSYYSSLKKTYGKYISELNGSFRDEIRIGVEPTGDGAVLEIHFSGENTPARLLLIKLASRKISKNDLHIVKAFASELHLLFKNTDAAEMRQSLLIQIRHAVIHAISAAEWHVDVITRKLKLRRLSHSQWLKLKDDVNIIDNSNKASGFIHEAVTLTDTGRYLFSDLNASVLRHDHVDPLDLINATRGKFESALKRRNVRLNWIALPSGLPKNCNGFVVCDQLLMGIVYTNLIDNAIKYARRESTVSIGLKYLADRYSFSITNVGDHLPESRKRLIFKRFYRGQSSVEANRVHGTGIGLPVCKMILDAHWPGANLDYNSVRLENTAQDAETSFTFSLPYRIGKQNITALDTEQK